ncbi:MAG TPA: hypothetical protein DCE56_37075 [Cyanobacteria bacterium UBA8553]|nr:hypothetical protein [Cyanobacteria bacterium UBA8553]
MSQRRLLKGWELPLAGLILMAGVAATVSTLQSTASQKPNKTVASTSVAPRLDEAAPQVQDPAIAPSTVDSNLEAAAPHKPAETVAPQAVDPSSQALAPQKPAEAIAPTEVSPPLEPLAPGSQEQAIAPTEVNPVLEAPAPRQQEQAVNPTIAAPPLEAPAPQPQQKAVNSTSGERTLPKFNSPAQAVRKAPVAQLPTLNRSIPDGTYLYGQSSEPQQLGKEYLVFEARQGKVVGAMYMPNSEYSCFRGTLASNQLSLKVASSYNQTALAHTMAAQPARVAAAGGEVNLQNTYDSISYPHTIRLEDYKPLSKVSENDRQILNSCRSNSQGQVE